MALTLEETIALMTRTRAIRVKTPDFEIELHPAAFVPDIPVSEQGAFEDDVADRKCTCGHTISEHSQDGLCLNGCSSDSCGLGEAHNS